MKQRGRAIADGRSISRIALEKLREEGKETEEESDD